MKSRLTTRLTTLVASALLASFVAVAQSAPSDAEIHGILVDRIDRAHQSLGIVVGVIEPTGRRVIVYGIPGKDSARPLDGDTLFQIGSVTKIFTSLLLSDMVQKKEVALADPVQQLLPATVHVPQRNHRLITLLDLATQSSGLPRLPGNFKPQDPGNPYIDYTAAKLYDFLSNYELTRDPGSQYEYSNLGFGLLGHALSRRAGRDYESLVWTRICEPLGMNATRITLTPEMAKLKATGHNDTLQPVPDWDFQVLAGAGALHSTANDLLKFLAANLEYTDTPLQSAMKAMQSVRHSTDRPDLDIGIGWQILAKNGSRIVWHNGGTYGFTSFVGFDPQARIGVVVLSNAFTIGKSNFGVDDIGLHLLNAQFPLAKSEPAKQHHEISVDAKILDRGDRTCRRSDCNDETFNLGSLRPPDLSLALCPVSRAASSAWPHATHR